MLLSVVVVVAAATIVALKAASAFPKPYPSIHHMHVLEGTMMPTTTNVFVSNWLSECPESTAGAIQQPLWLCAGAMHIHQPAKITAAQRKKVQAVPCLSQQSHLTPESIFLWT